MRAKVRRGLVWGALGIAVLFGWAGPAAAANCALYARAATGVSLFGAAGGWWDEAAGRYQRGAAPYVGAILVFRRSGHMPSGHVAVVSGIINSREVLIDHANWYRGTVTRGMEAIDTSPNNDWTSVAVRDLRPGSSAATARLTALSTRALARATSSKPARPWATTVPLTAEDRPRDGIRSAILSASR